MPLRKARVHRNVPVAFTASAFATAAPIPWPPPVTTATAPSKRRKHRLLEDRTQRVNEAGALAGGCGGGVTKISAWTPGLLERPFARSDGVGEGLGVGG